jgi:hypothetical protein
VLQLLDGQDTLDVRHNVKVTGYLFYLGAHVVSHRLGDFDMMA